MLRRFLVITSILLLCVSWVTIRLPVALDPYCQAAVASPLIGGHSVLVTRNPEESTLWKKELLRSAQHSVEFSMGFSGGPMLEASLSMMAELLHDRPEMRVHCFISDCPLFDSSDRVKVEALKERFPDRFHYLIRGMTTLRHGLGFVTNENHIKALIIDEKYVIVGGTNFFHSQCRSEVPEDLKFAGIVDFFHPKAFIDMDMVFEGPLVSKLRRDFFELWELYAADTSFKETSQFHATQSRYFPVPKEERAVITALETHPRLIRNVKVKALVSGPRFNPGACSAEYARLISGAEHSLDLMHMYMSPVEEVYDPLLEASSRGIAINLVTNGAGPVTPIVTKAIGSYNRTHLLPLMMGRKFRLSERDFAETCSPNRCNIYTFEASDTLYHKKVMVVDKHISVIGSYNLGYKSHYGDHELVVVLESEDVAREFLNVMEEDCEKAQQCRLDEMMDWHFGWAPRSLSFIEGALIVGPLY